MDHQTKPLPISASTDVWMLGINLSARSRWFQLVFCSSGIFFGFLFNGVCEEYVFKQLQFSYAWYFTFIQSLVYLSVAYLHGFRFAHRRQPWSGYGWLSLTLVGSMGLTKSSLQYLNYPAQIMFKSSKVIPVMLLGSCFPNLRRTYSTYEYSSAVILVLGLIIFITADAAVTPVFEVMGVILIVSALVCDAFLGNLQESMFKADPSLTQQEVLFCSTFVGLAFLSAPLILTGEIWRAWITGLSRPIVYLVICLGAICTYAGQLAILSLIHLQGAAATYIVTSLRKALSLALSYLVFTKPFLYPHFVGFLLIFISMGMKTYQPPKSSIQKQVSADGYEEVAVEDDDEFQDEKEAAHVGNGGLEAGLEPLNTSKTGDDQLARPANRI